MSGILALDQSTVTGWAFAEAGCEPSWSHMRMGVPKAWEGCVYFEFRKFLLDLIDMLGPKVLAFEAPFTPREDRSDEASPFNSNYLRRAYGLVSHITEIAERAHLDCYEYQTGEVTKFFTGRARYPGKDYAARRKAKKAATVAACAARGWKATADSADALAILMFAESKLYPDASRQRRMVLKIPSGPLFETHTTA